MKADPKVRIPRWFAVLMPPVAALLLASIFTTWQARDAAQAAAALCARFKVGDSLDDFVVAARQEDFEMLDHGHGSLIMIAEKDVYRLEHEGYRCVAHHDGGKIRSLETSMVRLER